MVKLSHTGRVVSATFDDPNLVSAAGLVPLMRLAARAGLAELADERMSVPTDKGARPGLKLSSLVAGMAAGADSIDDMALLRHGAMGKVFGRAYPPSTLGSFLRAFAFGHVRQADAVASRFLLNLAEATSVLGPDEAAEEVMVDIDDTIVEFHGYHKQGAAFGYSGVRGLNALLATVSTERVAPVIAAQRLRKGSAGSPRGAARLASDTLALVRRSRLAARRVLVRADSAFYAHALVAAATTAGAEVSITVRMDPAVKRAIASIPDQGWTPIRYTDAIYDQTTGTWVSWAEVAEIGFTAFTSRKKTDQIPGRLVVRRIPDLNPKQAEGQESLFDSWRFHAFFTTTRASRRDTVGADQVHRRHAIIENVHAHLKASALAHLPSGKFNANAARLICAVMAFNLTRAPATLTDTPDLARATTPTIRRTLINIPARLASSARRLRLHLPTDWPWQDAWIALSKAVGLPARAATRTPHHNHYDRGPPVEKSGRPTTATRSPTDTEPLGRTQDPSLKGSVDRGLAKVWNTPQSPV